MAGPVPSVDFDLPDLTRDQAKGPTAQDVRTKALLETRPELRQAIGLTGDEPVEGLHALMSERLSLLPPSRRDDLWSGIEASTPVPGRDGPGIEAGDDRSAAHDADRTDANGAGIDGPATEAGATLAPASAIPRPEPRLGAQPIASSLPLSPLDDRDYARSQAVQFWHTEIEPLIGLAARGEEAIQAAERTMRDPDATPGEVRSKLGLVNEYQSVIEQQWKELNEAKLPKLIGDLEELRMVSGPASAVKIEHLMGEIANPAPLRQFEARRETLGRTEDQYRIDDRHRAERRMDRALDLDQARERGIDRDRDDFSASSGLSHAP